jgi:hypothetical protein
MYVYVAEGEGGVGSEFKDIPYNGVKPHAPSRVATLHAIFVLII